ncbi:MAG: molecular chaperone DnaJ [Candidatus Aminicenantes bacterium RBG_13_59_9]|nr:MAG: molecular chaperone DnaJ [Candidatus Aminicenantes bacterium RBG_13_59_9]
MSKDYYATLGLDRKAGLSDIKKAYRKLARKFHPDLNPGDKAAEAKFKEIQEAYSVLSDPKKKAQFDQFGFTGEFPPGAGPRGYQQEGGFQGFNFSGQGTSSFDDLFQNIFGGGVRRSRLESERGEDQNYTMKVGFEDALHGLQTKIKLNRLVDCADCRGRGMKNQAGERPCPVCRGTGQATQQVGTMRFAATCPACGGSGFSQGTPCGSCAGRGARAGSETITVRIPAGVDAGSRVRIPGKGHAGLRGGPAGDLFITIEVEPHPLFRREGADLFVKVPISVPEAALGADIEVPTLDGRATIKLPPGTRSGQKFRLKGRGVSRPGSRDSGDEFVEVTIVPPSVSNPRVRELMKELAKLAGPGPREKRGSS